MSATKRRRVRSPAATAGGGNGNGNAVELVVIRWGRPSDSPPDAPPDAATDNWGTSGSSVSLTYSAGLVGAVASAFVAKGIVVTQVVHPVDSTAALATLADAADDALAKGYPDPPTGSHCFYFLWPIQFDDGPGVATPSNPDGGGFVGNEALFRLMRANERRGYTTAFPHKASLYKDLTSKAWTSRLCAAHPELHIPATVSLPRLAQLQYPPSTQSDKDAAVAAATDALRQLAVAGGHRRPIERVVIKLAFSWESLDVVACDATPAAVSAVAAQLFGQPGCYADRALLQHRIAANCELRLFVVAGVVKHRYYARYEDCNAAGRFDGWVSLDRAAAVQRWFGGDAKAVDDADARATALALRWHARLEAEQPGLPAFRCDTLVVKSGAGRAEVHTLELTELGFSMWSWDDGPSTVFGAVAAAVVATAQKEKAAT